MDFQKLSKKNALIIVFLSYIAAILISYITIVLLPMNLHPILKLLLADILSTFFIYILSMIMKNASLYDPYWSVYPFVIGIFWIVEYESFAQMNIRIVFLSLAVCIWGIRLTVNWARGWNGFSQEDWRYRMYRSRNPRLFWLINLFGIQIAPTIWVFLGCLPLYYGFRSNESSYIILDIVAFLICITAVVLERTADKQMAIFIQSRKDPMQIMNQKLWRYSRHPNYLGEISFWWGILLFGLSAANFSALWTIIGALSITGLFLGISIPMIEKQQKSKKPLYSDYIQNTSKLLLWFPKKVR